MPKSITNVEFRKAFGEILDTVHRSKKPITITQHGVPWVVLRHPKSVDTHDADMESALYVRIRLSEYLNSVHYQNKPLVITRRNQQMACVCPPDA